MPAAGIPIIPKGFTQPIFIEVCVPYGQPAGNYSGQIAVSADSGPLVSVPVALEVWAIDLPRLNDSSGGTPAPPTPHTHTSTKEPDS